jgi:RNA 3'-terminal phosphate cyclase
LADQLMLLQALAAWQGGAGEFMVSKITQYARTNAQTIATLLPVRFVMA